MTEHLGQYEDRRETAAQAVREYLRADPERCQSTCRVGCPCDGGNEDSATGALDGAQEIVAIVWAAAFAAGREQGQREGWNA